VTTTTPESFTLDGASNITARTGPAATYTIDGENRPISDGTNTLVWSDADRLTARGSDTFGYDPLDRLVSSTVAGTTRSYAYSGDGLLQSRTQSGNTTSLLWDSSTAIARLLQSGADRIVYGLGPLYIARADGTTRALARDGGKSVRAEIDGTGAVTGSWRYRAYGETSQSFGASTPTALGYAGQLLDPSGLYYMRARWYDAASGRFMSRDPLLGAASSPETLNSFGYGGANPVLMLDPSGLALTSGDEVGLCDESGCEGDDLKKVFTCLDVYCTATTIATPEASAVATPTPSSCLSTSVPFCLRLAGPSSNAGASPSGGPSGLDELLERLRNNSKLRVLTGYTKHGIDSAISHDEVGVSTRAIRDAVTNPQRIVPQSGGRRLFIGKDAAVVLNAEGKVMTTWARSSSGWRAP